MKVFISWSGERSRIVAELLHEWLQCVLQAVKPWLSNKDLDRGTLWFGEINDQLKDTSIGIVCLTQENKARPWILFEAGALTKGLSTSRVCTLLIDLSPKDIEGPLAQFNHTIPNKESMLSLVRTLNRTLGSSALDDSILEQVFNTYWSKFDEGLKSILGKTHEQHAKPRPKEDLMAEVLELTRNIDRRLRNLEARNEPELSTKKSQFIRIFENKPTSQAPIFLKFDSLNEEIRKEFIEKSEVSA